MIFLTCEQQSGLSFAQRPSQVPTAHYKAKSKVPPQDTQECSNLISTPFCARRGGQRGREPETQCALADPCWAYTHPCEPGGRAWSRTHKHAEPQESLEGEQSRHLTTNGLSDLLALCGMRSGAHVCQSVCHAQTALAEAGAQQMGSLAPGPVPGSRLREALGVL